MKNQYQKNKCDVVSVVWRNYFFFFWDESLRGIWEEGTGGKGRRDKRMRKLTKVLPHTHAHTHTQNVCFVQVIYTSQKEIIFKWMNLGTPELASAKLRI